MKRKKKTNKQTGRKQDESFVGQKTIHLHHQSMRVVCTCWLLMQRWWWWWWCAQVWTFLLKLLFRFTSAFFLLLIRVHASNIDALLIASPAINIVILRFARGGWIQAGAAGFAFEAGLVPFLATSANLFHGIYSLGAFWAICWIRHSGWVSVDFVLREERAKN